MRRQRESPATPCSTYTEWWWPPSPTIFRTMSGGYRSFEHVIVPEVDPGPRAAYLWAHEFSFLGGDRGYLGLQAETEGGGDGAERTAVFSIQGAQTCRIPYPWQVGRAYEMQVWTDAGGWWSAAVREGDGPHAVIGRIQAPGEWRRLASTSVMSTEYRGGPLARCADLPPSRVTFSVPTADGGTVSPVRHESRLGAGTCRGSSVEVTPDGVRHVMGGAI
jgi:hypothetical protein